MQARSQTHLLRRLKFQLCAGQWQPRGSVVCHDFVCSVYNSSRQSKLIESVRIGLYWVASFICSIFFKDRATKKMFSQYLHFTKRAYWPIRIFQPIALQHWQHVIRAVFIVTRDLDLESKVCWISFCYYATSPKHRPKEQHCCHSVNHIVVRLSKVKKSIVLTLVR